MANSKDDSYLEEIQCEVDRLKALSDSKLLALPEYASMEKTRDGLTIILGVWHQEHPDGFDAYIVHAKRDILWRYGHIFVDGFIRYPDGRREPLPDYVAHDYS